MFIVGFNGPPQCGKDTLARLFAEVVKAKHPHLRVLMVPLSNPLRFVAHAMIARVYSAALYESFKKETFPQFGGRTGRQLMIDVSESFLKPVYGQSIMADMLIQEVSNLRADLVLIPDSGFQCEVQPIIDWVGYDKFLVCRVHRDGCSFENDSREWVEHPVDQMNTDIYNDGSLADLETEAGRLYGRCVNQKGWKF